VVVWQGRGLPAAPYADRTAAVSQKTKRAARAAPAAALLVATKGPVRAQGNRGSWQTPWPGDEGKESACESSAG
jgi:hypothetical protein